MPISPLGKSAKVLFGRAGPIKIPELMFDELFFVGVVSLFPTPSRR
jgi:hypothetical protein